MHLPGVFFLVNIMHGSGAGSGGLTNQGESCLSEVGRVNQNRHAPAELQIQPIKLNQTRTAIRALF
jgi:hypothetical protein